jgi:hypothetical protein
MDLSTAYSSLNSSESPNPQGIQDMFINPREKPNPGLDLQFTEVNFEFKEQDRFDRGFPFFNGSSRDDKQASAASPSARESG